MKTVFAFALIASTACAQAAEQKLPISDPRGISDIFTPASLESFYNELEFVYERAQTKNGDIAYVAHPKGSDKANFYTYLRGCPKTKDVCYGLEFAAVFATPQRAQSADVMNNLNGSAPFPKVMLQADGTTLLSRYVISDGGITRGNQFMNLAVFFAAASGLAKAYSELSGEKSVEAPRTSAPAFGVGTNSFSAAALSLAKSDTGTYLSVSKLHPEWVNDPAKTKDAWRLPATAAPAQH